MQVTIKRKIIDAIAKIFIVAAASISFSQFALADVSFPPCFYVSGTTCWLNYTQTGNGVATFGQYAGIYPNGTFIGAVGTSSPGNYDSLNGIYGGNYPGYYMGDYGGGDLRIYQYDSFLNPVSTVVTEILNHSWSISDETNVGSFSTHYSLTDEDGGIYTLIQYEFTNQDRGFQYVPVATSSFPGDHTIHFDKALLTGRYTASVYFISTTTNEHFGTVNYAFSVGTTTSQFLQTDLPQTEGSTTVQSNTSNALNLVNVVLGKFPFNWISGFATDLKSLATSTASTSFTAFTLDVGGSKLLQNIPTTTPLNTKFSIFSPSAFNQVAAIGAIQTMRTLVGFSLWLALAFLMWREGAGLFSKPRN